MPNKQAAKKSLRQDVKRAARNKLAKAEIASLRTKLRKLITDKNTTEATTTARLLSQKLDKAESKGVMKRNTVARTKSRLMAKLNASSKK